MKISMTRKLSLVITSCLALFWGAISVSLAEPTVDQKKPEAAAPVKPAVSLVITDFEKYPNLLGGDVAVEGDAACDWKDPGAINGWYYNREISGFTPDNVHGGLGSFRMVNGGTKRTMENWASFYLLLGPITDASTFPAKIKPLDVSAYSAFHFWIKGAKGGERFNVVFRDALAANNFPQAHFDPMPEGLKPVWQEVSIPVAQLGKFVDVHQLVFAGLEFGTNLGNKRGDIIFIDDVEFIP